MFDAVLNRSNVPQGRIGTGATISIFLHAGLIAFALWISMRPAPKHHEREVAVKFMLPPPPPQTPPKQVQVFERKPVAKPDSIIQPKEIPKEKPPEAEPEEKKPDEGV